MIVVVLFLLAMLSVLIYVLIQYIYPQQRFASEKEGDREVQRTMLELLNQLDGFSSHSEIKVRMAL